MCLSKNVCSLALVLFVTVFSTGPVRAQSRAGNEIKDLFHQLIMAENAHDEPAVRALVWNSPSMLFVAKAPSGWHAYWGSDNVMEHLHEMYQTPFKIEPIYDEERVVFIRKDIAETYSPVNSTVAYAGQQPVPKPFNMVLLWIRTPQGWRMATDLPIPVPPDPK
jgi:hypothetical protein